ncbi:MAG: hypothetical protein IKP76_03735 [Bacilli bacterium]|nr:hypothetical protein [Bacilli bacterium]
MKKKYLKEIDYIIRDSEYIQEAYDRLHSFYDAYALDRYYVFNYYFGVISSKILKRKDWRDYDIFDKQYK